VVGIFKRNFL